MTLEPAKQNATYDDVREAPPDRVAELLGGSLFLQPPTSQTEVIVRLTDALRGTSGWVVRREPKLQLAGNVLVPDVAGWRTAAAARPDSESGFYPDAPQWVCEVLSKTTRRKDRLLKLPLYAAAGVEHAWLIDPANRVIETHGNEQGRWELLAIYSDVPEVRAEPFDGLALAVEAVFGPA